MFKKIVTQSFELSQVQANTETAFRDLDNKPFNRGVILENVTLQSGVDNRINHGLQKKPVGFVILKKNAGADVWESSTSNSFPELTLILSSSANLTVNLWIF